MSSDTDSTSFLPKSLQQWLQTITLLVALGGTIAAPLAAFWKATEGEVSVPIRLGLALTVATPVGFAALSVYSFRRYFRLKQLENATPKPLRLSCEELDILKFFAAHDGQAIRAGLVLENSGLPRVKFLYHWEKLETSKLIDHVGDLWGEGTFMLSHAGRAFLFENGHLSLESGQPVK